jgi:hypothetical protein
LDIEEEKSDLRLSMNVVFFPFWGFFLLLDFVAAIVTNVSGYMNFVYK